MAPNLILITGLPASGKSSFAEYASRELSLPVIGKDDIKEHLFDTVGFRSYEEKTQLDIASANIMMYTAARILSCGESVILDNNFEDRNLPNLEKLVKDHTCNVITVRFKGDVGVIYKRFLARESSPSRHLGHKILNCYPPVPGKEETFQSMTQEQFTTKYKKRGTFDFAMGTVIDVDVTDFSKVSYPDIISRLKSLMV